MSQKMLTSPPLPLALTDIIRLTCDTGAASSDNQDGAEVTAFANYIAWQIREKTPPKSFDWIPIGNNVVGLSPPLLRAVSLKATTFEEKHFLLHLLTWRYLARRLSSLKVYEELNISEQQAEQSLVHTARMHRSVISGMLHTEDKYIGDCTAVAVKSHLKASYSDTYLITFKNICDSKTFPGDVVSRAKDIPADTKVNRFILFLDSIETSVVQTRQHKIYNKNVHLFCEPNEARFVIIVSDLRDPAEPDVSSPRETSRHRLNSSLLRDVFIGGRSVKKEIANLHIYNGECWWFDMASMKERLKNRESSESQVEMSMEHRENIVSIGDGGSISMSRIAREFFGYKGIPDSGLKQALQRSGYRLDRGR